VAQSVIFEGVGDHHQIGVQGGPDGLPDQDFEATLDVVLVLGHVDELAGFHDADLVKADPVEGPTVLPPPVAEGGPTCREKWVLWPKPRGHFEFLHR